MTTGDLRVLLLDADGVVQRPAPGWREMVADLRGPGQDPDAFLHAVFTAERPCMRGDAEFAPTLADVLERFESPVSLEKALEVWTRIEPDPGVLALIAEVDLPVCLATNQQQHRAQHMKTSLGYAERFETLFISCELGVCKPERAYFDIILAHLGTRPAEVLLVDDQIANVDAARGVGLEAEQFHVDEGPRRLEDILVQRGLLDTRPAHTASRRPQRRAPERRKATPSDDSG